MKLQITTLISGVVLQAFLAMGISANDLGECISSSSDLNPSRNTISNIPLSINGYQKISTLNAEEVKIFTIQGEGDASEMVGQEVITEGVVIGVFQSTRELKGYFLQDTTGDNNNATSDGIFILDSTTAGIRIGNYIHVSGTVSESGGLTHLINSQLITTVLTDYKLKNVTNITLPSEVSLERYEGMLVNFNQTLTISDVFRVGQHGELLLSANGRLFKPAQTIEAVDLEAIEAQKALNASRSIILDDGSKTVFPTRIRYFDETTGTIRAGSTISGLKGIIDFDGIFKVQPVDDIIFDYAQRPAIPQTVGANLKVASFNLMNFFNGDGSGENFSDSLGASDHDEYVKQKDKIISALSELNADIVCLSALENDGNTATSAIVDLVNTLNTKVGAATYQYASFPTGTSGNTGTDLTTQGIIYKPSIVTPVGNSFASTDAIITRPALAQIFTLKGKTNKFAIVASDFKNRYCNGSEDMNNKECYHEQRVLEATALTTFIESIYDSTDNKDVLLTGNLNTFELENPIQVLAEAGLKNVMKDSTYTEITDGESGSMLHVFATSELAEKLTSSAVWHINADEPSIFDYQSDGRSPRYFTADAFRSSDVDPIIVGLNISEITGNTANESFLTSFNIAPNPATDKVLINWFSNNASKNEIVIKNTLNQEIFSQSIIVNKGENELQLSTDEFNSGLYFVEMITENKKFTGRFIITK